MKFTQVVGAVAIAILLAGCATAQITDADLVGTYSGQFAGQESTIELHDDGTAEWSNIPDSVEDLDDLANPQRQSGEGDWVLSVTGELLLTSDHDGRMLFIDSGLFGLSLNSYLCDPDHPGCRVKYDAR